MGLRAVMRGDDLKGATRRRGNLGFCDARESDDNDQAPMLLLSFASRGLTARTTSRAESGEFDDVLDEREVLNCMRVGLEGERDNDLRSLVIAEAS